MRATWFPWMAFVLAVGGTAAALWISLTLELIGPCRVYLDGCSSISAAGRQEPARTVFRAAIIPAAVLLMLIWIVIARWFADHGLGSRGTRVFILLVGAASPALPIIYVILLGDRAPWLDRVARVSIYSYFPVALIVKIYASMLLLQYVRSSDTAIPLWVPRLMLLIAVVTLVAAVVGASLNVVLEDPRRSNNLIEWHAMTLYTFWYPLLWVAWQCSSVPPRLVVGAG